ncbi:MAG TPA: hypothetical protein VK034_07525 [Enhygromyxa sp.]|nr:hypothetical protein [Enhygromyxa sp.]
MPATAKYLERFAEPEARLLELAALRELGPWTHAITIPVRCESIDCLRAVAAPAARARTLLVLVVNAADDPQDREDQRQNAALIAGLRARAEARPCGPGLALHRLTEPELELELDVLLVDRSTPPRSFSAREGVGLARKIGADLIARLIAAGLIDSPWIHTTDADAELPAEHFDRLATLPEGAAVAPFRHVDAGDPAVYQATLRYELSLRYYVLGLRSAGSPCAFHTIGSLISVAAPLYAKVRGFPRRQAGEDFYLLDKLAKLGPVHRLDGAPVRLRSRRSTRTPFGTGPAVESLLAGKLLAVYDPRVFEVLGRALATLAEPPDHAPADLPELADWYRRAHELADRYGPEQLPTRLPEHFDGFRTLKLIHALTARWPKLPWSQALARARFLDFSAELPLEVQREQLATLEGSA